MAVGKQWAETSWAKSIARKSAKTKLTDFDRFKLMIARKTVRPPPFSAATCCFFVIATVARSVRSSVDPPRMNHTYSGMHGQRARVVNTHLKKMLKK